MEIGLSKEPANLVLETLRTIRADIARVDEKIDVKIDGLRNEPRLSVRTLKRSGRKAE
jgi:hypothetical protein